MLIEAPPSRTQLVLPNVATRLAMFDALRSTIERIDGDGLVYRGQRSETWDQTLRRLRTELEAARTLYEFGRVFRRLDATYPNLHTRLHLHPALDELATVGRVQLPIAFRATQERRTFVYRLTRAEVGAGTPANPAHVGDELLAINGRSIDEWTRENETFCEFPLREQCAERLHHALRNELLFWHRSQPLTLTLRREGQMLEAPIRVHIETPSRTTEEPEPERCGVSPDRYSGFAPAWMGRHACVFTSPAHPGVAVLRIRSFQYRSAGSPSSVESETQALWNGYWRQHAEHLRTLVIDVIENHGGQAPIPYYRLLFRTPFQEQYLQLRNFIELHNRTSVLNAVLWNNSAHELWQQALARDGVWERTPVGAFFPPVPQFCPTPTRDCREGMFQPLPHKFRGDVRVLMNAWCVSSCSGFVWNLRRVFGDRFRSFGAADSGDTTFSRIAVAISPDEQAPNRVRVVLQPTHARASIAWLRQIVSVTRTTDAQGTVLSGIPTAVDVQVDHPWNISDEQWNALVFQRALQTAQ